MLLKVSPLRGFGLVRKVDKRKNMKISLSGGGGNGALPGDVFRNYPTSVRVASMVFKGESPYVQEDIS